MNDVEANAIRSESVLTLVMTRAHIVAVMADERVGQLGKLVGCLLWAITETWERGEVKTIPWSEVAAQVTYPGGKHPSRRGVADAVAELEAAGYLVVDRSACRRSVPAEFRMVRRRLDDPLLRGRSGSDFRVWTKAQEDEYERVVGGVDGVVGGPESRKGAPVKGASEEHPYGLKGASEEHPYGLKGASHQHPLGAKGCFSPAPLQGDLLYQGDPQDKVTFSSRPTPPFTPPSGDVSAFDASQHHPEFSSGPVHAPSAPMPESNSGDWDRIVDGASVARLLLDAVPLANSVGTFPASRQREVSEAVDELIASRRFSIPAIVLGVGAWAGDRKFQHANYVAEFVDRFLDRWEPPPLDAMVHAGPVAVMASGYEQGRGFRVARLDKVAV